ENATNGPDTKGSLQDELNGIEIADVPAVTDANSNDILDSTEVANAKAQVEEAKKAAQAAKDATTAANADGVINPDEAKNLTGLQNVANRAKE
ncbi:hypothetical protein B8A46_05215, partial [Dolosigranulum pigrum]|uniref:GA-like domain-containing protein n=1 Tax=Dolosigranulum pigrum TaxID=29394 RepID=UPI000DBF422A